PGDGVDVDFPTQQPLSDRDAQAAVTRRLSAATYRRCHGHRSDVLAFGQDGCSEALDPIHGNACHPGHILEGLACPDPRLDVPGGECGLHLDLQLSESRQITAQRCTEPLIRLDHELLAALGSQDQGLPIWAESDQSCGAHPSRWLLVRHSFQLTYSASPRNCGRRSTHRATLEILLAWVGSYCRSMRDPLHGQPAPRDELRASGYVSRRIKAELRDNRLEKLRSGATAFPGIVGFDATVLPELEGAILAGHDLVILGERGQGKTRLMRTLAGLLDEWSPQVAGCEIHDDPYVPVCVRCRSLAAELGDELPVEWRHRDERYTEKLATPDTSVGDLIGDVDPVKVAQGRTLGDPETVHYGLVPRTNRGVFGLNELPD